VATCSTRMAVNPSQQWVLHQQMLGNMRSVARRACVIRVEGFNLHETLNGCVLAAAVAVRGTQR